MKNLLFVLSFSLSASFANAQTCGEIVSSGILPANPVAGQESWLNLQLYCNVGYFLQYYDSNISGNTISVDAYYCQSFIQVITYTNDSIPLGPLPAGNYTYTVNIFSSNTDCQSFVQTDQAAGTWQVTDPSAGLSVIEEGDIRIYPNPFQQSIQIEPGSAQPTLLCIRDLQGQKILEREVESNSFSLELPPSIANGIYFLSLSSREGTLLSVHKIMKEE